MEENRCSTGKREQKRAVGPPKLRGIAKQYMQIQKRKYMSYQ